MKFLKSAALGLLVMAQLACLSTVEGQLPFRRTQPAAPVARQAPPVAELTDGNGPWLIMVTSFVGDEGEIQAKHLAMELANEFKTSTFIYRHSFDFSEPVQGIGWERVEVNGVKTKVRPKQLKPQRDSQFDEIAVLIGEFLTIEDAKAQRALQTIKSYIPESLGQFQPDRENQTLRGWREFSNHMGNNDEIRGKGPLRAAFLMPNPLLPDDFFNVGQVDDLIIKINKRAKHSLLENPATYTVRVATFRGKSTFNLNEMEDMPKERRGIFGRSKSKPSSTIVAAEKAHRLTEELRKLGVEAYEFHDRFESYVCVGEFDWIAKGSGNMKKQNPEVVAVIQNFKATVEDFPGMPRAIRPKVLPSLRGKGIVFDSQPLPVKVPKVNASTANRFSKNLKR